MRDACARGASLGGVLGKLAGVDLVSKADPVCAPPVKDRYGDRDSGGDSSSESDSSEERVVRCPIPVLDLPRRSSLPSHSDPDLQGAPCPPSPSVPYIIVQVPPPIP